MKTISEGYNEIERQCIDFNFYPSVHIQEILIKQGFGPKGGVTLAFAKILEQVFKESAYISELLYEYPEYADQIETYFDLDDPSNYHYLVEGKGSIFMSVWAAKAAGELRDLSFNQIAADIIPKIQEQYKARIQNSTIKSL